MQTLPNNHNYQTSKPSKPHFDEKSSVKTPCNLHIQLRRWKDSNIVKPLTSIHSTGCTIECTHWNLEAPGLNTTIQSGVGYFCYLLYELTSDTHAGDEII